MRKFDMLENDHTHKQRKSNAQKRQEHENKPWLCCFTCGYQKGHNSSDCNVLRKARNHQNNATASDTKGGN